MNVTLTQRAGQRIAEIAAKEAGTAALRISVEGGGCSGFSYKFELIGGPDSEDLAISNSGGTIVIDPVSLGYLAGSEVDFVDDLIGASFKIKNPNATSACGCGTSFSI
ncbi:MAG: HesB/IscA family protein [Hyphomicrobiaceae bacterium]